MSLTLSQPDARIFVPDGAEPSEALSRITHLGVGAHQDDLEFMATHGILECFHRGDQWFGGVTCTDGAGSARSGDYSSYTDAEMQQVRIGEQEQAAVVGRYGAMVQLGFPSAAIKDPGNTGAEDDLLAILESTRPRVVYTHQPADKHDTHIGVMVKLIAALRRLPEEARPEKVYGCEVWRGLDWADDGKKIALDVSGHDSLVAALNGIFDSQIAGGKRYDLAVEGRKLANATFFDSHSVDDIDKVWFALDLTPLITDPESSVREFIAGYLKGFADDVDARLAKHLP